MESLLNFNFLKDISVKNNNGNNTDDKSLSGDANAIVFDHNYGIENEFNNILSEQKSNESSLSLEKQKSKKSKANFNIDSTETSQCQRARCSWHHNPCSHTELTPLGQRSS